MAEMAVGKTIRMPCMRKGLCAYHDETVYLTQEVLEQLAQTGHGIPVTIEHPEEAITGENVGQLSVGRVSKMEYSLEDDLWYAEFVVETEEAAKLLRDGWGVSTAWYGDEYGGGGTLNNVPYDREVKRAHYEHLAIVKTPRYEMAIGARFLNSKTGQAVADGSTMEPKPITTRGSYMLGRVWKMITTKEEIKTNSNEDLHVEVDGEAKPLKNILEDMKAMKEKQEAAAPEKRMLCGEDEVEVDGKKMSVNELIKAYKDACGSPAKAEGAADEKHEQGPLEIEVKHEEEPMAAGKDEAEEKKAEGAADEDDKKEASAEEDDDEKKKKEAEGEDKGEEKKKTNSRFAKIKELHENGVIEPEIESSFTSTRERVELGRVRYGTK
jgi:hypothetical protein